MNPFETHIIRVTDPLSPHTRGVRKSLLIASVIAIAVAKTGFIPTKISALGLEFSQADRGSMLWLVGTVVGFLLVSFLVAAFGDFLAWRMSRMARAWEEDSSGYEVLRNSYLTDKSLSAEERESLKDQDRAIGSLWRNAGYLKKHMLAENLVGPVSWTRVAIEFFTPAFAGVVALVLLVKMST